MIRLEKLTRTFSQEGGEVVAVRDVSLQIAKGECVCLIGGSGCGKTTTLRLINRLLEPTSGRVLVDGEDTAGLDPIRLRRRMGYVVQSGALFPHLTVRGNVELLCRVEGWSSDRTTERADELLRLVRLPPEDFAARFPSELSGGQRQRVGVARALALDPEILLMDEPFGALDPVTRREVQEEFLELEGQVDKTTVIVTHDLNEAFLLGDRVALMAEGEILQVGTLDDFRTAPAGPRVEHFLELHLEGTRAEP
ncbi:MAG: ATP-binding cassette domain-containing protein [Gemmatimonadota bacterium]